MPLLDNNLSKDLMNLRSDNDEMHLDTADNEEAARKITEGFYEHEELFILYSKTTQLPFVVCDEETFEDEVFVYTDGQVLQDFAKIYTKDKYALSSLRIVKEQIPIFLNTMFSIGADTIMFSDGGAPVRIYLEDLAGEPTYPKAPNDSIPRDNPGLQLTAINFLQKLRRPIPDRSKAEMAELRTLEEEMVVNMMRSKFIIVFDAEPAKEANGQKQLRIPFVKAKNGDILQPIFTDFQEVQKFTAKMPIKHLGMTAVGYDQLTKMLGKAAKAYAINPAGINLVLNPAQIKNMKSIYGEDEE